MKRAKTKHFVKVGTVKVPWYRTNDGRTGIDLRALGGKIRTFTNHSAAITEAERIARERHNGGAEARPLTAAQRVLLSKLEEQSALLHVDPIALINAGVSHISRPVRRTVDIAAEFLTAKNARDFNRRYSRGLTADVNAFIRACPADIRSIEPAQIQQHVDSLDVGPARRNTALENIRQMFNFARARRKYLPHDEPTAAHLVDLLDEPASQIHYLAVWEMELLLAHVRDEFLPWLACRVFSGLRHEEIVLSRDAAKKKDPLRWEDFDWDDLAIAVREETAKQTMKRGGRSRRIPILPNLYDILRPWRDRRATGPIYFRKPDACADELNRMVRLANAEMSAKHDTRRIVLRGRKNALRHSYGSYRMALIQNEHALAYEMGNSIDMVRRHYHNPRPKAHAAAWFQLRRETPGNVIQVELFGARVA